MLPALLFTGLPGAGKSTLAHALSLALVERGLNNQVLDGDVLRAGPCADLGYSDADRLEQARRAGAMAQQLRQDGILPLVALIAPRAIHRSALRAAVDGALIEVWCSTPLAVCEARDPKGLYAAARAGTVKGLTGIDAPYEPPQAALALDTSVLDHASCVARLLLLLAPYLSPASVSQPVPPGSDRPAWPGTAPHPRD
ncbi:adenylyl-sulfate kinase [Chitinolyticbacter meiyuanensis]|uniref:adenylyl-sulfate kinase n=1 Tax=Chitinolyticbacter meiyuanensis TaxID=682798 RepID=UPI0011E59FF2|nr:adenylyl-sulfate kinase [Chitinolyticbacter meiyuanensis]